MHRSYYKDSKESYIVWDFLNIQNTPIKRRPACLQTRGWRHLSPVHAREPFAQLNQPEVRMVEEESQSQDLYNVSASENSICSLVRCLQRTEGDCSMQCQSKLTLTQLDSTGYFPCSVHEQEVQMGSVGLRDLIDSYVQITSC